MAKTRSDDGANEQIIAELIRSYWMEMETVQNYLANSQNLDGVRAEEIKKSLAADVTDELGHAQQIAGRIRVLGGTVPGSMQFKAAQKTLQPPAESTDVVAVIKGVIDGLLHSIGEAVTEGGRVARHLHAGFVRGYAAIILVGALILIGLFAYWGSR